MEAAAVVHLLVMRISSTREIDFVHLKVFIVSLCAANKSLPEYVMSAGMTDESRERVKLEIPHLALRWHLTKDDVLEVLG